MLFLDMEPNWFLTGLRTFLASISAIIYELIGDMYSFFLTLGRIDLLSSDTISGIYTRVSMLLGLFMLFKLLFSFLQMMINPDLITDKQKGVGNIIIRILVVVVMLGSTPAIFQAAFRFQGLILDEGVIEKLVLSKESNSNTANAMGNELSWTLFNQFYHLEGDLDCSKDTGLELLQMEAELYGSYNLIYNCIDETENTNYGLGDQNSDIYVVHWDGWTAIAVGIFVLWILLMYCISVGVRVIQLAFLQLIAPIPIISYLMPGKNDSFQKWGKQCLTTYLDLFIRIALISFIFVMIGLVFNDETIRSLKDNNGLNWVMIFLVLGLLLFAKKAPELLKELFPSSGAASISKGIKGGMLNPLGEQ